MKRTLLAVILVGSLAPLAASAAEGCEVVGRIFPSQTTTTCSYTATGAGTFEAHTPGRFTIIVTREGSEVIRITEQQAAQPQLVYGGALATEAGDVVSIEMRSTCVAGVPQCAGLIGRIAAKDN